MTVEAIRSTTVTLSALFYDAPEGALVAVVDPTVAIITADGALAYGPFTAVPGIDGTATYSWAVPGGAALGPHVARWTATILDTSVVGFEPVQIADPGEPERWVDLSEVTSLTGRTVTDDALFEAQAIVDMVTDSTPSTPVSSVNRALLEKAVAFQAVWLTDNPDALTSLDVAALSQLDLTVNFRDDLDGAYLGPLVKGLLRRVTWIRARTVALTRAFEQRIYDVEYEQHQLPAGG